MNKKLLLLAPLFILTVSCASNGTVNADVPSGGTEVDLFETSQEEGKETAFQAGVKKAAEGFDDAEGYKLSASSSQNFSLKLDAQLLDMGSYGKDPSAAPTYVKASANIDEYAKGKAEFAYAGFDGEQVSTNDIYGYAKGTDLEASLKLDYAIPESYLALIPSEVGEFKANDKFDFTLNKTNVAAYLNESKVYVDASDANIEKFYTSVVNSDLVKNIAKAAKGVELPTFSQLLEAAGLQSLKFFTEIPAEANFRPQQLDIANLIPENYEKSLASVEQDLKKGEEILKAINFKVVTYGEDNKYAIAFGASVDKASVATLYEKTNKAGEGAFEAFLKQYGITMNDLSLKFSVALLANGGFEVNSALNIDVKVDALKIDNDYSAMISSMASAATLEVKLGASCSVSFVKTAASEVKAGMAKSYDGYTEIPFTTVSEKVLQA